MKTLKSTNYIVINDFRAVPLAAAMDIYKRSKIQAAFIVSARFFRAQDYGENLPWIYKYIKWLWLWFRYDTVFIRACGDAQLNTADKLGIISSLQSITCDSSASDLTYPRVYKHLEQLSIGAKEVRDYIIRHRTGVISVYIFNGRTASSYPIVRGCFDNQISMKFYEYADGNHGYKLYPCAPHNTTQLGKAVSKFRHVCIISAPDLYKRSIKWRKMRLSNPFTKTYRTEANKAYDVSVFLGSDHEYTCVDEDISGFRYRGNYELVKSVIKKYGPGSRIAVKAHPNQAVDKNHQEILNRIEVLCADYDIDFFSAKSEISSYDLIRKSRITAVEFSSIAFDAILLGKTVDIFSDLDLKYFLAQLHQDQRQDSDYVVQYISELMILYDNLYFEPFIKRVYLLCKLGSAFEWWILRAQTSRKD